MTVPGIGTIRVSPKMPYPRSGQMPVMFSKSARPSEAVVPPIEWYVSTSAATCDEVPSRVVRPGTRSDQRPARS